MLLPLSAALVGAVMVLVLLARAPGSQPVLSAGALCVASAELGRALVEQRFGAPGAGERLALAGAEMDRQLDTLERELELESLPMPELGAFRQSWHALRAQLAAPADAAPLLVALDAQSQSAGAIAQRVREQTDTRRDRLDLGLKALMAALAALLLLPLHTLWRQRQRVRSSLHQFSDELGAGTWRDAVHHLREESHGAPSAFDALASGVENVLGESDRRWQALADLSADWYWECDRQYRLSWLSGSATAVMSPGCSADALLGRRHDQIGVFRAPAQGWAAVHECMAREEAFRDVEFEVTSSRAPVWVSISGRARYDAHGRPIGYEGVGRDISARKTAHAQLLASEQRWSTMAQLASDWYWQTDAEHCLLPLSADQQRRFGANVADRVEGRTRWDAYRDALSPQQWAEHRADLDARRPFRSLQLQVEDDAGRLQWISISGIPRFDGANRFIGYHGVGRDITTRKQAERLLLRHNEELQRAVGERTRELQQLNLDLDAFARQLAHELRSPIAQLQGLAQMLLDRAGVRLDADERQLLGLQLQAAHSMRDTLDALMELARSTLQPMPQQAVALDTLALEVLAELPALERAAAVHWDIGPGPLLRANPAGAEDRARQPARQRRQVQPRRAGAARAAAPGTLSRRPRARQRQRQRHRLRPGARDTTVQAVQPVARARPLCRHRHRAEHRAAHRRTARRQRQRAGHPRRRRVLQLHAGHRRRRGPAGGAGRRRPRRARLRPGTPLVTTRAASRAAARSTGCAAGRRGSR